MLKMTLRELPHPQALLVLSPALGAIAYLSFMRVATGNPFEMFVAMQSYVSAHSLRYVLHPLELARLLGEWPLAIHGFTNSMIDRAIFVLFLLMLVPVFRRVHIALAIYALAIGLLNVLSGTFMSYSRYILLAFPLFVAGATLLQQPGWRAIRMPVLFGFVMLQGAFLVTHALSYWVA